MRTRLKIILWSVIILLLSGGGWLIWRTYLAPAPEVPDRVEMFDARIAAITPMLQLCVIDFMEDIPVKGNVGHRHLVGKARVCGSISFDMDSPKTTTKGDTLLIELPREVIDIRESTDPGSYEVIDTWNDRLFGSDNLTAAEENAIKLKAREDFRKTLYSRGTVRRARQEAGITLTRLMEAMSEKPVIVTDPTPDPLP